MTAFYKRWRQPRHPIVALFFALERGCKRGANSMITSGKALSHSSVIPVLVTTARAHKALSRLFFTR
ncbi:hypothetical protein [Salaquimonas pukyongi]|uniref:hypothetical protein n=1 Tax=Salaquimonas pukyongi TaxID=2712698 RepID=UPI0012EBC850|nr:hypothetical protein [Salaquimonas pukyongi]